MWLGVHFVTINNNAYERISTKKIKTMPKIAALKELERGGIHGFKVRPRFNLRLKCDGIITI